MKLCYFISVCISLKLSFLPCLNSLSRCVGSVMFFGGRIYVSIFDFPKEYLPRKLLTFFFDFSNKQSLYLDTSSGLSMFVMCVFLCSFVILLVGVTMPLCVGGRGGVFSGLGGSNFFLDIVGVFVSIWLLGACNKVEPACV